MRELPADPVFTSAAAYAVGWTPAALRHAVRSGRIVRVAQGWYAAEQHMSLPLAARTAGRRYPQGVLSHRTALLLHQLPIVGSWPRIPELTVPPRSNANLAGVHVHRATLRRCDVVVVDDAVSTSPARTLVDVARNRPLGASVPALDAALHCALVSMEQIEDVLLWCWNWPGIGRAQRAVRLADGRAESPLESVSRLVLGWLRLPPPEPQKLIFDAYGRLLARLDFYWDEYGVFGEADGRSKYDSRDVLTLEKQRQEQLEDLALIGVRWGWNCVTRRRHALRERVLNAFARGTARDRSGFPRKWSL